jgi:cysteine desulfurase
MIYADYNSTTPMLPEVLERIASVEQSTWGNPSSIHGVGRQARGILEKSREQLATRLGAEPGMILFTSGGTEANNWVLRGHTFSKTGRHLAVSSVEHPSLLKSAEQLAKEGTELTYLPVNHSSQMNSDAYAAALMKHPTLCCCMVANNETGTIFPIQKLAKQARTVDALFHADASQAIGKIPINFLQSGVDFMAVSAHKFYGPKGIGALLVRNRQQLEKIQFGGGQEFGIRAGTEPVALICGMVEALEQLSQPAYVEKLSRLELLRDRFEEQIQLKIDAVTIHGDVANRLPNTSNLGFMGVDAHSLLMNLDLHGVACATRSACHSGNVDPPHVLKAMGLTDAEALSALRFSFGMFTTVAEIDQLVVLLVEAVDRLRKMSAKK